MIRKYLPILLAALVLLQSIAASADAQQFHLDEGGAFAYDHVSSSVDNLSAVESSSEHHCCHCHGFLNIALLSNDNNRVIFPLNCAATDARTDYFSHFFSPDIRPPIL